MRPAIAALLVFTVAPPLPQPDPLGPRTKGRPDAPVTVYEMADFQCPACRTFALEIMPVLEREYIRTGKVRWVFVNFPLTDIHANAVAAAEVAMCAARQQRFWEMHDALFQRQPQWAPLRDPEASLVALADSAGVDRAGLAQCLTARETVPEIEADARRAARAGARSTPTFYIEGGLLRGAAPVGVFRGVLDSIYGARTAPAPPASPPPASPRVKRRPALTY
ncbi:MAG: DsbA family protein, partial [Gemmatimonadales bacterium]